jgi:hypothetical protein
MCDSSADNTTRLADALRPFSGQEMLLKYPSFVTISSEAKSIMAAVNVSWD